MVDEERFMRNRSLRSRTMRETLLSQAGSSEQLYVDMVYWVVYQNAQENVSLDLVKAQHQMTNACFCKLNGSVERIPTTGRYNHSVTAGEANITFLPSNYNDLTEASINRVAADRVFTGLSDVIAYLSSKGHAMTANKMNVIIAPLSNLLGEAFVEGNVCVVHWASVGGDVKAGAFTAYRLGITAVHEIGHNLGLPHVFGGNCTPTFSDIPTQIYPNYNFQLFETGGVWDGKNCNRQRDCQIFKFGDDSFKYDGLEPPYSCFNCPDCDDCDTQIYEQAMNFMDYGNDDYIVMFSKQQIVAMRQTLVSGDAGLTLVSTDGGVVQQVPASAIIPVENDAVPAGVDTSGSSSGISTGAIIGIVAGIVVLLIVFIAIMSARKKK